MKAGAVEFLTKPLREEDLLDAWWTQLGPRTQGITEETATPWGRPESFSIEGARRLRSSGAPQMSLSLYPGHASGR